MRKIKFRGVANNPDVEYYGEWVYGDLIHLGNEVYIQNDNNAPDVVAIRVDPDTVGQFTGSYDKNKEIYEDDIVCHQVGTDIIKWDIDCFTVGNWEPRGLGDFLDYCKVIGNKHKNPELMKNE